ncbi:MAG: indolepyruvate ferredoxin oxidoreductase subunit alpha [Christensenellales bacterium]|jgi:indolepyruvate ferredoxin oxidoreductase alpha subunit
MANMEKRLMLGNEAIARGAWEGGVRVVSSYPGTPSTEITESMAKYTDVATQWAVNEKVALEVAAGAGTAGVRAMTCMKHVGVNVCADPLFTLAYTGVRAGVVIVCADDPAMHSSQNEQDSRFYARSAHVPMLEPADSEECRLFTKMAFSLSERFDTPVMVRTTTRISHARSLVNEGEREDVGALPYEKDMMKYVMMPGMAKGRHVAVEKREIAAKAFAEETDLNREEMRETKIGIVTSGASYQYVREALPEVSVFKLGMVYPLPIERIRAFAQKVEKLYVVEELEPFFENRLRASGIACEGKNLTGLQGELSARKVASIFGREVPEEIGVGAVPARPPVLCAGCPHRGPYSVLSKLKMRVNGDIGCYTLGALKPLSAVDTVLCMGASVGMAQGFALANADYAKNTVGVIGDSTFLHSGITSLINACYNRTPITLLILDNSITGMTGHQPNPASGKDIYGNVAPSVSLEDLCRACGVEHVVTVDAFDLQGIEKVLKEETARDAVSVIICRRPCALLDKKSRKEPLRIDGEKCRHCFACMKLACPAIVRDGKRVFIDSEMCVGCGLCRQVCKFGAIVERAGAEA